MRHIAKSHGESGRCVASGWASSGHRAANVQVLPGLEIVIAKDASPLARRLARQFIADCLGKPDAG